MNGINEMSWMNGLNGVSGLNAISGMCEMVGVIRLRGVSGLRGLSGLFELLNFLVGVWFVSGKYINILLLIIFKIICICNVIDSVLNVMFEPLKKYCLCIEG